MRLNSGAREVVGVDVVDEVVVEVVVGDVVGGPEVDLPSGLGVAVEVVVVVFAVAVVVVGEVEGAAGFTVVGGSGRTPCLCNHQCEKWRCFDWSD